jgi:phenylalanyl-tRNA synthetase beta chain
LLTGCEVFDLYIGEKLPSDKKSLAFRLTYQDSQKTLSDEEINALHQKAVQAVCQKLTLSVR